MDTPDAYLERLASAAAVPGGGSASALVASLGAALVAMVARIAGRNPKNASSADRLQAIALRSDELRAELAGARRRDEEAFTAVVAAQALPKSTEAEKAERRSSLEQALTRAAEEPLRASALSLRVLELVVELLDYPTEALASDLGTAAEFAAAALAGCAYNVRINHRFMRDAQTVDRQDAALRRREAAARGLLAGVRERLA